MLLLGAVAAADSHLGGELMTRTSNLHGIGVALAVLTPRGLGQPDEPILVAQLHGLGEVASLSSSRPFFVREPLPRRELDRRCTSRELWALDALIDLEGWTTAGYDVSLLYPVLRQTVISRAIEGYTCHGLATVDELALQAPCNFNGIFPVGGHQWVATMESEMFWGCSGLAHVGFGAREDRGLPEDDPADREGDADARERETRPDGDGVEDDLVGLVQEGVFKPGTRRRAPRREETERRRDDKRDSSHASRASRPPPRTPPRTPPPRTTTSEVRTLRPVPKKCPPLARARASSSPAASQPAAPPALPEGRAKSPPESPNPLGPLTLDEAVETWVHMLGLASVGDTTGSQG